MEALQARAFLVVRVLVIDFKSLVDLIGAGNNPMVGMTVAVAVAIEEASK